jgi:hypothetical protein
MRGENHPQWNPNLKDEDRDESLRFSPECKQWKRQVLKRDNYTCQISGQKKRLRVHHIESWGENELLRFVISNGITISDSIHKLFHRLYGYGKNTALQFEEFKQKLKENPDILEKLT